MQDAIILLILFSITSFSFYIYIKKEIQKLNVRINTIEKLVPDEEEYKKHKDDVKTLYQNQTMLLSLVNAVRVRINNFYAKKLKEPKLRSSGFDESKNFGETKDGV